MFRLTFVVLFALAGLVQAGEPEIKECKFKPTWQHERNRDVFVFTYEAVVVNNSKKSIDELSFYVRYKDSERTIPIGENLKTVEVKGGIEPGETKLVTFTVPTSKFELGISTDEPPLQMQIAIVSDQPADAREKLYKFYARSKMQLAKFYLPKADK
jgi:hypothetical protein